MEKLNSLTKTALPLFKKKGIKMAYKKGQLFFRPEDSAQGIYYLDSGQAMVFSAKENGLEQIVGIFEEGAIFGKIGTVISQPFTIISIKSLTDCIIYRLTCEQFQTLLNTEPTMFDAYMKQVSFNNVFILNQILVLGERNIYLKLLSQILLLAGYYGDNEKSGCVLRIVLTQEQMANMLCITREYLSKTLKKIKLKKIITVGKDGRIRIPDINILKREIERSY